MELKLMAKEDRPNNAGVGIAESPKSKFFSTRGGCAGSNNNKLWWVFLCYYRIVTYIEDWRLTGEISFDSSGRCYERAIVVNFCDGKFIRFDKYYSSPKCWLW
jgi:hypothetical protein